MAGKSLAELNAEAKRDPFVLDLGDGRTATFPQPTFGKAIEVAESTNSIIERLIAYAAEGDRDALEQALNASAPTVPQQVHEMVLEAWGMGNGEASPSS